MSILRDLCRCIVVVASHDHDKFRKFPIKSPTLYLICVYLTFTITKTIKKCDVYFENEDKLEFCPISSFWQFDSNRSQINCQFMVRRDTHSAFESIFASIFATYCIVIKKWREQRKRFAIKENTNKEWCQRIVYIYDIEYESKTY